MIKMLFIPYILFCSVFASLPTNYVFVFDKETIENRIQEVRSKESLWIVGALADSFENEIVSQMAQESGFENLRKIHFLNAEEYRSLFLERGFLIHHIENQRDIQVVSREWLESELAPRLGLGKEEGGFFAEEFLRRANPLGLHRQIVIQVSRP